MRKLTLIAISLAFTLFLEAQTKFWVFKNDGTNVEFAISDVDSISFTNPNVVEKCKASDYTQVTIGTQTWMAENYMCSKYDTESEAYKEGRTSVPTSNNAIFTPYYTDATDRTNWSSAGYAGNLTGTQIANLGYLYNWAATVGVANGANQTARFSSKRQGICPNGWHIPTASEFNTLEKFLGGTDLAGGKLKAESGWYQNGDGTDDYGFAALPAGYSDGMKVTNVGYLTFIWTSIPREGYANHAYYRYFRYDTDSSANYNGNKSSGQSVRCLKN